MPQFLLTIGVIVGDLLFSNLNTWIWQCKAWCQRWQGQDIVQKQLAGMYKLWFLTVFSININTAAPRPATSPASCRHTSAASATCATSLARGENCSKRSHVSNIHPSIHPFVIWQKDQKRPIKLQLRKGFHPHVSWAGCFMWTLLFWIHFIFIWAIKNYGRENIRISLPLTLSKIWKSNLGRREKQFFLLVKIFHS